MTHESRINMEDNSLEHIFNKILSIEEEEEMTEAGVVITTLIHTHTHTEHAKWDMKASYGNII